MRHLAILGALCAALALGACGQAGQETASSETAASETAASGTASSETASSGTASSGTGSSASAGAGSGAAQQRWAGTWAGRWENDCQGAIEVAAVTADSAQVRYSWGDCGDGPPGRYVDPDASIADGELTVHLSGQSRAVYTHVDGDTLRGEFRRPSDGTTITGTFQRQG